MAPTRRYVKVVVAAFNQEKALLGTFSVISNLQMDLRFKLQSPVPSIRNIDTLQTRAWPRSWCWCWWWAGHQIIALLLLLLDVVTCCLCFLRPTVVSVVFVTADGILNRQFSNPMPLLPSPCCL